MPTKIFVNLPVKDLKRSMEFFSRLGYSFNEQFTDEKAASMVISDDIYVMLLTEPFFTSFTGREINDTSKSAQVIICLSSDSRAAVDELVSKAVAAGAVTPRAAQDHGFMYSHGFEDLDGHIWETVYMDPSYIQG
ncbi:VOC family protein [uncultured Chitinophaga sp.]|jgi:Predicted lactoylglutathione lyase|uniref:VOC family protein n=1 Tax=uncultured Chitinophaga sp. TaxID=339340 RepID=UPI00260FC288|nr:VOC family protein [uncultured Chitinophaga sp.]